jgi:uncharacterized protein (UPF0333 family)
MGPLKLGFNRRKEVKGQISLEFIIAIIFVLAILLFGVFIFQNRTLVNQNLAQTWEADNVAHRVARNINNVYLMDNNTTLSEYIYFSGLDKSIEFGEHVIRIYNGQNYSDAPLLADFNALITDLNGWIEFKKIGNQVIIDYGVGN